MADFSNIAEQDCVIRDLGEGETLPGCRTLVLQSVLNEIKAHGRSSMHKEVCGVLVGNLCWDREAGAYLLIDTRIEGKFADHQTGSVTFTSETWDYMHSELSAHHGDKRIVGWYHTHPGFGIFLSNMDVFIHENFFNLVWQPAYVFDPQAETDGFFFWKGEELEQETVTVIPDEAPVVRQVKAQGGDRILVTLDAEGEQQANARFVQRSILVSLMLLVLVLIGLAILFLVQENQRLEQRCRQLEQDCQRQQEKLKLQERTIMHEIFGQPGEEIRQLKEQQDSQVQLKEQRQEQRQEQHPGELAQKEKTKAESGATVTPVSQPSKGASGSADSAKRLTAEKSTLSGRGDTQFSRGSGSNE